MSKKLYEYKVNKKQIYTEKYSIKLGKLLSAEIEARLLQRTTSISGIIAHWFVQSVFIDIFIHCV